MCIEKTSDISKNTHFFLQTHWCASTGYFPSRTSPDHPKTALMTTAKKREDFVVFQTRFERKIRN